MNAKNKKQSKTRPTDVNDSDTDFNHGIFHSDFFRFGLRRLGPIGLYVAARIYGAALYAGRGRDPKGYTTITATDLSRQTGCLIGEANIRRARTKLRGMGLLYNSGTNSRPRWHQTLDRPLFRKSLIDLGCPHAQASLIMARVMEMQDEVKGAAGEAGHGS